MKILQGITIIMRISVRKATIQSAFNYWNRSSGRFQEDIHQQHFLFYPGLVRLSEMYSKEVEIDMTRK